ncbi:MAG: lasso RiPP family leader peptide-containing protein [Planctomycetes bacterium]|nr:lasso RiPP family leader peptide-containing protein [Planctomycetota bacterium]
MQPDQNTNEASASPVEKAERQPYKPPQLTEYGTVQELTRAMANDGSDNNPEYPNGSTF